MWRTVLHSYLAVLIFYHPSFSSADSDGYEMIDAVYPDISNCFQGAAGRDDNYSGLQRIDDFCRATNKNRTSLCFKMCVLDMWRLIGRDRITLNEDIDRNPQNYKEISSSRLLTVDYRAISGPVWAIVAVRMLEIPFAEMKNNFKKEKELMTKRMDKCKEFRFQTSIKDNKPCGNIPHPILSKEPELTHREEWEKLIDCIEDALDC